MTKKPDIPDTENQDNKPNYPTLSIDWDLYGQYLEESDLSDEKKRELIETIWGIMISFVDLGFGVESVQCAEHDQQQDKRGDQNAV